MAVSGAREDSCSFFFVGLRAMTAVAAAHSRCEKTPPFSVGERHGEAEIRAEKPASSAIGSAQSSLSTVSR